MELMTPKCRVCGSRAVLEVDEGRYALWRGGLENVQDALPELDADQRELLLTGTHAHCWERLFGADDD